MFLSTVAGDPCNGGLPWECEKCRCGKCRVLQEGIKDGSLLPRPRLLVVPWARGCWWCRWSSPALGACSAGRAPGVGTGLDKLLTKFSASCIFLVGQRKEIAVLCDTVRFQVLQAVALCFLPALGPSGR